MCNCALIVLSGSQQTRISTPHIKEEPNENDPTKLPQHGQHNDTPGPTTESEINPSTQQKSTAMQQDISELKHDISELKQNVTRMNQGISEIKDMLRGLSQKTIDGAPEQPLSQDADLKEADGATRNNGTEQNEQVHRADPRLAKPTKAFLNTRGERVKSEVYANKTRIVPENTPQNMALRPSRVKSNKGTPLSSSTLTRQSQAASSLGFATTKPPVHRARRHCYTITPFTSTRCYLRHKPRRCRVTKSRYVAKGI